MRLNFDSALDNVYDLGDLGLRAHRERVELAAQDVNLADGRGLALLDGVDELPMDADQCLLPLDQGLLGLPREALEGRRLVHGLRLEREELGRLLRRKVPDVLRELGEIGGLLGHRDDERGDPVEALVQLGVVHGKQSVGLFNLRGTAFEEPSELRSLDTNVYNNPAFGLRDLLDGEGRHRCKYDLTFVSLDGNKLTRALLDYS